MISMVVVGAGVAGTRVVRRLREYHYDGSITLLDAQRELPYDRPPLSKKVLRGEQGLPVLLDREDLASLAVNWRPGSVATGLDANGGAVVCAGGDRVLYDNLVIATGARARRIPDINGRVLRTFADAVMLRSYGRRGCTVLIVGAGLVGCEVAASLSVLKADVHLVDVAPVPMLRVMGAALAQQVVEMHRNHGVVFHLGTGVRMSESGSAILTDGTVLHPDLVLEATGAEPDLRWLRDTGLETLDGVHCDDRQRTGLPGVYAVGDVAAPHGRRSEHWTAAAEQADRAVAAILGLTPPPPEPPYWWSDQYTSKLQGVGDISGADEVLVGDAGRGRLALFARNGQLVAAVALDAPAPLMRARNTIVNGGQVDDAALSLRDATKQSVVEPPDLDRSCTN